MKVRELAGRVKAAGPKFSPQFLYYKLSTNMCAFPWEAREREKEREREENPLGCYTAQPVTKCTITDVLVV